MYLSDSYQNFRIKCTPKNKGIKQSKTFGMTEFIRGVLLNAPYQVNAPINQSAKRKKKMNVKKIRLEGVYEKEIESLYQLAKAYLILEIFNIEKIKPKNTLVTIT